MSIHASFHRSEPREQPSILVYITVGSEHQGDFTLPCVLLVTVVDTIWTQHNIFLSYHTLDTPRHHIMKIHKSRVVIILKFLETPP